MPALLLLIIFLSFPRSVSAATYYVSPSGHDANPGTVSQPFLTVNRGLSATTNGDTLFITSGTYNLNKLNTTLNKQINIIGEDKNTTILTNGDTIVLRQAITVSNLTFSGFYKDSYNDAIFRLDPGSGETIDGLRIENCIFDDIPSIIWSNSLVIGDLKNITIANNQFRNLNSNWSVFPIRIHTSGRINNIIISHNHFENIYSTDPARDVIVININYDGAQYPADSITVNHNTLARIRGGTQLTSGSYYPAGRGILVYGNNVRITGNYIADIDQADFPRNCIYIKGSQSSIDHNVLHNCGSSSGGGSGDLTIKGETNIGNIIKNNHVTSDAAHPDGGYAIFSKGGVRIEGNYVNREYGVALYSYDAIGRQFEVLKNQLRARSWAARISQADTGLVADNLFVSLTESAVAYINSGLPTSNNILCYGSNCTQTPPVTTCTNTGNYCTTSCANPISAYNQTCDSGLCCPEYTMPTNPTSPFDTDQDGDHDFLDFITLINHQDLSNIFHFTHFLSLFGR